MKTIIVFLVAFLAFSTYMALTSTHSENKISQQKQYEEVTYTYEEYEDDNNEESDEEEFDGIEYDDEEPAERKSAGNYPTRNYQIKKPSSKSVNSIEQEITNVFGNENRLALAVAKAESNLNPRAVNRNTNGSRDIGVFQINDKHGWSDKERLDWRKNIRMAKALRDRNGWGEWTAYNNGSYRHYL